MSFFWTPWLDSFWFAFKQEGTPTDPVYPWGIAQLQAPTENIFAGKCTQLKVGRTNHFRQPQREHNLFFGWVLVGVCVCVCVSVLRGCWGGCWGVLGGCQRGCLGGGVGGSAPLGDFSTWRFNKHLCNCKTLQKQSQRLAHDVHRSVHGWLRNFT